MLDREAAQTKDFGLKVQIQNRIRKAWYGSLTTDRKGPRRVSVLTKNLCRLSRIKEFSAIELRLFEEIANRALGM